MLDRVTCKRRYTELPVDFAAPETGFRVVVLLGKIRVDGCDITKSNEPDFAAIPSVDPPKPAHLHRPEIPAAFELVSSKPSRQPKSFRMNEPHDDRVKFELDSWG